MKKLFFFCILNQVISLQESRKCTNEKNTEIEKYWKKTERQKQSKTIHLTLNYFGIWHTSQSTADFESIKSFYVVDYAWDGDMLYIIKPRYTPKRQWRQQMWQKTLKIDWDAQIVNCVMGA
jgi:hypothetical protein